MIKTKKQNSCYYIKSTNILWRRRQLWSESERRKNCMPARGLFGSIYRRVLTLGISFYSLVSLGYFCKKFDKHWSCQQTSRNEDIKLFSSGHRRTGQAQGPLNPSYCHLHCSINIFFAMERFVKCKCIFLTQGDLLVTFLNNTNIQCLQNTELEKTNNRIEMYPTYLVGKLEYTY